MHLIVSGHVLREPPVCDSPDSRFVHAHSEADGGHNARTLAARPALLYRDPVCRREPYTSMHHNIRDWEEPFTPDVLSGVSGVALHFFIDLNISS